MVEVTSKLDPARVQGDTFQGETLAILDPIKSDVWIPAASAAENVAPTLMVGNRWIWNRTDAIPDHLLPLNGQVVATADVDFPELWSVRALSALIASFDDTAKTITLKNYNGQGRFARAGAAAGVEQNDATAVNGLRTLRTYVQSDWNGQSNNDFGKGSGSGTGAANNSGGMSSSDSETRPINVSEIWCIIAKPWVVSGDVIINVPQTPTTFLRIPRSGNQTANNFTANALYAGENTGPVTTSGFGNWWWRIKVTRIGDWISQHYWNDSGGVVYRESFNGGANWTPWYG